MTFPAWDVLRDSRSSRGSNTARRSGTPCQTSEIRLTARDRSPEYRRPSWVLKAMFRSSRKISEIFLLDRNIAFSTQEGRRYSGDRSRAVSLISLVWQGVPLRLAVFDPRDERLAFKTSQAGKVIERAGIAEVGAILSSDNEAKSD